MNINSFFPDANATEEDLKIEDCKKMLFKLGNRGYLNTLQYAYFENFFRTGSVCNINLFLQQIETLRPTDERLTVDVKTDIAEEFKKIIGKAFNIFFRYDGGENKLRINRNIRYYLTRSDTILLTCEQSNAMKKMYDFLINNDRNTFGLYGYAGSGKTTCVVEYVAYMIVNKYMHTVCFSAPTNKALNVIKTKFKPHLRKIIELSFKRCIDDTFNFDDELIYLERHGITLNFLTIHKLLAFQPDYSVSGDIIFVRDVGKESLISKFELVIIDECSMIGIDMVDNIFEEIKLINNKTYPRRGNQRRHSPKIIFTGDPAQLPPVNESDSSIFCKNEHDLQFEAYKDTMSSKFADDDLRRRYNLMLDNLSKMETILMKNVVRSKIRDVTKVCCEIRKWIKSEKLPNLKKYKCAEGVYFFNNERYVDKIESDWFQKCLNSIKNGGSSIIITWTNKQTDIYNNKIRKFIFGRENTKKFEDNDILILSDFYNFDTSGVLVKEKLYTSEQIKINSVEKADIPIKMFTMIDVKKLKQCLKIETKLKTLIDAINHVYCKETKFFSWILKVHKIGEDVNRNMTIIVVDDIDFERYELSKTESNKVIKNFTKQLINQYRTCPRQVERYVIKPLWTQWNKIFVEPFANVNYGYSITCHKAQGSSFYDVYMDLHDILSNNKDIEAKKCAYTAATRASNELNILI